MACCSTTYRPVASCQPRAKSATVRNPARSAYASARKTKIIQATSREPASSEECLPKKRNLAIARDATSNSRQDVAHFCFFGLQIGAGNARDAWLARHAFDDTNPRVLKLANFLRIIGEQTNFLRAQLLQNLRGKVIVARIRGK